MWTPLTEMVQKLLSLQDFDKVPEPGRPPTRFKDTLRKALVNAGECGLEIKEDGKGHIVHTCGIDHGFFDVDHVGQHGAPTYESPLFLGDARLDYGLDVEADRAAQQAIVRVRNIEWPEVPSGVDSGAIRHSRCGLFFGKNTIMLSLKVSHSARTRSIPLVPTMAKNASWRKSVAGSMSFLQALNGIPSRPGELEPDSRMACRKQRLGTLACGRWPTWPAGR